MRGTRAEIFIVTGLAGEMNFCLNSTNFFFFSFLVVFMKLPTVCENLHTLN